MGNASFILSCNDLLMIAISVTVFLSGLSALIYQLLWMRALGFVFGNTIYSSTTVLTAFMGGLAIGSHLFGRWANRFQNPIRVFAMLEWVVAGYAVLVPFFFHLVQLAYRFAAQNISDELAVLTPLRFILSILILMVPTIAMGGTLPVLMSGLAREEHHFGARLGWLYGINTLGAVAGVFLSGFWLIPAFGLTLTNILAVVSDVLAGCVAWALSARYTAPSSAVGSDRTSKTIWRTLPVTARYAIAATMLCGFTSLALEVIWFRALILVFGSTTYSFTVMLGVFLLGMALGSLAVARLLDCVRNLLPWLAGTLALIGAATLWSLYRFDRGPELLLTYLVRDAFSWSAMNKARFLIALSHLAAPALLFGAAFTMATRIVRHETASSSGAVGLVYALNTAGAVAGSLVGGFVLLPAMGMEKSLLLIGLFLWVAGVLSLAVWQRSRPFRWACAMACLISLAGLWKQPPVWNKSMLASGAFFAPYNFVRDGKIVLREMISLDRLLHYQEALASTVSVHIGDEERKFFCVDGKTEADQSPRSMVLQRMIGHLPALLHPNARSGVNIGLGAGVSFGALGCHPLDHLEVVEINPAVKYATRVWGSLNHNILDNPRAVVTINDGRNHLFCTPRTYDIITADPFEPVMAGAAHLYSVDYFQLARDRLNADGIMGQYLPLYEMSLDDYLTIVRSFVKIFPNTALFYTGFDTILIGFKGEVALNAQVLRRNFEVPAVKRSLAEIGFTSPEMLLGMFVADLSQHPEFAGSGRLNTDEHPVIEYSTPRSALHYTTEANQAALLSAFTPIPEAWLEGLDDATAEKLKREHEAVRLMLQAAVLRARDETEPAFKLLDEALATSPSNPVVINEMVSVLVSSAQNLRENGEHEAAFDQFRAALALDPYDFWSLYYLVDLTMQAGDVELAGRILQRAMDRYPESPLMMGMNGKYIFTKGDRVQGLELAGRAALLHPGSRRLWLDLGMMAKLADDKPWYDRAQGELARLNAYIEGKY